MALGIVETERLLANRKLAHVAGAVGIAGQLAAAFSFILVPALTVPPPATYLFFVAWFVLLGLAIAWWRRHPWRSFLVTRFQPGDALPRGSCLRVQPRWRLV